MSEHPPTSSHHLRCESSRRVAAAARGVLSGRALVSEPCNGWVSIWDEGGGRCGREEVARIAAEISRRLHAPCVSFLFDDPDHTCYWLHDGGELVDRFDSGGAGAFRAARREGGDSRTFARYCLEGTDPDDVQDVLDARPDFEQDRIEALAELLGIEPVRASLGYESIAEGATVLDEDRDGDGEDGEPPEPSEPPEEPPPPLHEAARRADAAAIRLLLEEGADADAADSRGRRPLHHAAESLAPDYEEMEAGERREWWRRNAQARAAALDREEEPSRAWDRERRLDLSEEDHERGARTVRALLEAGASVDAADARGRRPLQAAAAEGHAMVARELLVAGAAPDAADEDGRTALHASAEWGWDAVIEALLAAGARVDPADAFGWTPLMLAAEGGYSDAVERLLAAGADPRRENAAGRTAAGVAGDAGREVLAARLREL